MNPRIIIVNKQTNYSKIIKESIDLNNNIFSKWKISHDQHYESLEIVTKIAEKYGTVFNIEISNVNVISEFSKVALVITVGGDGTLLGTSHNINDKIPVLGVNSDPSTSVGFFCTADIYNVEDYIKKVLDNDYEKTILNRMLAKKNGIIVDNRILNDVLYCHTNPATTSSYILEKKYSDFCILNTTQKSSGFWIGPAAGSTGARRSAGFKPMSLESKYIQLCVRELYYRPDQKIGLQSIEIDEGYSIHAYSKMSSSAMYIDGDHKIIPICVGDEISFQNSNESLILVGKPKNVFCK